MSAKLAAMRALADQEAAEGIDLNEVVKGGGGRLLPEGYAFGRLVEYIEYGNQPQEFNGKAKDPALEYTLGFALWGQVPDPADPSKVVTYHNDDGTPYIMRTYATAISQNEKSRTHKLFKALNWKLTAKNLAQLIGETYLIKIKHVPKSKADQTLVSRIDLDGFLPPLDPVTRAPYAIPEAADDLYRMFIWNRPTKEAWDALFVEGKFDDGKSKNRVQETIIAALDFQGSPLQQLLLNAGVPSLPTAPVAPTAAAPAQVSQSVAAAVMAPNVMASAPVVAPVPGNVVAAPLAQQPAAVVSPSAVPTSAVTVPVTPVGTTTSPSDVAVAPVAPMVPPAVPAQVAAAVPVLPA